MTFSILDKSQKLEKKWVFIILFLLFIFYSLPMGFLPRFIGPSETSRSYMAMALYEKGTVCVDSLVERYWSTKDLAEFDGHYYSNKPPGSSLLLLIFLPLIDLLIPGKIALYQVVYFGRILSVVLPFILFLYFFGRQLERDFGAWTGWGLILAYALGTNASVYSTLYYGHNLAAIFQGAAFILLRNNPKKSFWAGMLSGIGVLMELISAPITLALLIYSGFVSAKEDRLKNVFLMFLGTLGPAAVQLYYNYACSGDPYKIGYSYSKSFIGRKYIPGSLGISLPKISYIGNILFSSTKGLLWHSPWLFLFIVSFWDLPKQKDSDQKKAQIFCLVSFVFYLIGIGAGPHWAGGWGFGPRYLTASFPFLIFLAGYAWKRLSSQGEEFKIFIFSLITFSIVMHILAIVVFPNINSFGDLKNDVNSYSFFIIHLLKKGYGNFTWVTLLGGKVILSNCVLIFFGVLPLAIFLALFYLETKSKILMRPVLIGAIFGLILNFSWSQIDYSTTERQMKDRKTAEKFCHREGGRNKFDLEKLLSK